MHCIFDNDINSYEALEGQAKLGLALNHFIASTLFFVRANRELV